MTFELQDVGFAYHSKNTIRRRVFSSLTLSVQRGECVGVLGHEGAGKTTLLQCMAGLLRPDGGSIDIDGVNIWQGDHFTAQLRRQIGFAFQFPEQQFFCDTIEEELLYARNNFRDYVGTVCMAPHEALNALGLDADPFLHRSPFSLSMGEARRVALATLLMTKPNALLLDEPTVGLDGAGTDIVVNLLSRMKHEGVTVVVVSHDVDVLAEVASRIIIMENGRVLEDGAVQNIFVNDLLLSTYGYGVPEIVRIMRGEAADHGWTIVPPPRVRWAVSSRATKRSPRNTSSGLSRVIWQ